MRSGQKQQNKDDEGGEEVDGGDGEQSWFCVCVGASGGTEQEGGEEGEQEGGQGDERRGWQVEKARCAGW